MNVLVTGGAGYIGSHTVRLLLDEGHNVWVYDNLFRGHRRAIPEQCLIEGEISDAAKLSCVLEEVSPEAVIHFAALTSVGESVENPNVYYENNLSGTLCLLKALRDHQIKRLVFSSTAAVYGIPNVIPVTEDAPLAPINPYGRTKLAVEQALADHAAAYELGYIALRYFNAAGAHPSGEIGEDHSPETHLIPIILQVALGQRASLQVFGDDYDTPDGTCIRDYVHVCDLAKAHLQAIEAIVPGTGRSFNLGSGRGYSVKDVVNACERVTGRSIPLEYRSRRPGDPAVLVASANRARQELDWKPDFESIEQIVETAWRWHYSHPYGYRETATVPA